jgi:hypothetical protein
MNPLMLMNKCSDVVTSVHPVSHEKLDPRMIKPFDPGVSGYSQPLLSMLDERGSLGEFGWVVLCQPYGISTMRGGVHRRPVYVLDVKRLVDYIFRVIFPPFMGELWPGGLLYIILEKSQPPPKS